MHRFKRILAGVELADDNRLVSPDGLRERCANALEKATWLAKQSGAQLRIVHSLPISPRTYDLLRRHGGYGALSPADEAEEMLQALGERARAQGVRTSHRALVGAPAVTLPTEARDWNADLIVVAGRDRESSLGLLGSTAARLFRTADVPVWLARRGVRSAMRDVLAAVTLDEHSHGVLRLAADTARRMRARFHVLHVADGLGPKGRAFALDTLEGWTRTHAPDVRPGSVQVLAGRPADVIVETAADLPADAVFVGPSKRSALLARIGGSTTPLLKRLHCSLICARGVPDSPRWRTRAAEPLIVAAS
jgi:universal stress protein G